MADKYTPPAEEVRKERKKNTKNDAVVRLASAIHESGRAGVEAEWESTSEFHNRWRTKSRDMLARAEWRRRKLTKRVCPLGLKTPEILLCAAPLSCDVSQIHPYKRMGLL